MWPFDLFDVKPATVFERAIALMKRIISFRKPTNNSYEKKVVYKCRTCNLVEAEGLCYMCANYHHQSHDLVYTYTNFTCNCQSIHYKSIRSVTCGDVTTTAKKFITEPKSMNSMVCTFTNSETNFVLQSEYRCKTCKVDGELGICYLCANQCHQGHDVYYVRYGNFSCDCGARGRTVCRALGNKTTPTENSTQVEKKDLHMYNAFECPVCMSYMCAPIHMCQRGHSVCSACITKITECPLCRGDFSTGRNLTMEALGQALSIPCEDCEVEFPIASMNNHKKVCPMKDYICPVEMSCCWTGKFWGIYTHCKEQHRDKVLSGSTHVFILVDCSRNENHEVKIINTEGILFLFHRSYDKELKIYRAVVTYLDPHEEDSLFSYSLQFTSPSREDSVLFKKMVRPGYEDIEDIFRQNNCATLSMFSGPLSSFVVMDLMVYRLSLQKNVKV